MSGGPGGGSSDDAEATVWLGVARVGQKLQAELQAVSSDAVSVADPGVAAVGSGGGPSISTSNSTSSSSSPSIPGGMPRVPEPHYHGRSIGI